MNFADGLGGRDRRSIGQADHIAAIVLGDNTRFPELWGCLGSEDPVLRMRAADALEKVSRTNSSYFEPMRKLLLAGSLDDGTAEVRWHLIAIASRLSLSTREAATMTDKLATHLRSDSSRIVKVAALQAMSDISARHHILAAELALHLDYALSSPWPSLRARARILIAQQHRDSLIRPRRK